jgi:preprotein translocase SecE subunit
VIGVIKHQTKELLAELSRVDWPSKDKVMSSTWSIVIVSVFVGFFLWGADLAISYLMKFLLPGH